MSSKKTNSQGFTSWRFIAGVLLFGLGLIAPVFIPLVLALDIPAELKVVISGGLAIGIPEILWAIAVVILGKDGFYYIKDKTFFFFKKHALPERVSRGRYIVGLVMFILPIPFGWIAMYVSQFFPDFHDDLIIWSLAGNLIFFCSFFVLGGEFWEKFKALFYYNATVKLRDEA